MNQLQQRCIDSLRRVQDFLDTHFGRLGAVAQSEGRTEIDTAVATVAAHHTNQGSADRVLAGEMSKQRVLAKELVASHMRPIKKFAFSKLRGIPDFADLTVAVNTSRPKKLVHQARTMAATAAKYANRFVGAGLAPNTIERLTAATDALEAAINQRAHQKGLRLVSTSEIGNALVQGRDGVRVIDAAITQLLPPDDSLISAWQSVSRVEGKPGKARKVGVDEQAPPTGQAT